MNEKVLKHLTDKGFSDRVTRHTETIDPELTIDRALEEYSRLGYDADWINQRLQTIRVRKELTDAWQSHGIRAGKEYAILTDEITKAWSEMSTRQYKNLKGLKKENLRDKITRNLWFRVV